MEITVSELLKITNPNIIDIRDNYSYNLGHIVGAVNIEALELLNNPNKYLNKSEVYYIYCDSGNRSKSLVNKLNSMGYNTVNIIGGYNNYLFQK